MMREVRRGETMNGDVEQVKEHLKSIEQRFIEFRMFTESYLIWIVGALFAILFVLTLGGCLFLFVLS
jgi:uncharacterized integral membrane protein